MECCTLRFAATAAAAVAVAAIGSTSVSRAANVPIGWRLPFNML